MSAIETVLNSYGAEARRIAAERRDQEPAWLHRARAEALQTFQALGFPTTRDEEWRFTSVSPIAEGHFALAPDGLASLTRNDLDLATFEWNGDRAATLVFVNGRYVEAASRVAALPPGVRVDRLARAVTDATCERHLNRVVGASSRHAFTALNTSLLEDGAFIEIPDSTVLDAPVHLVFLSAPSTMDRPIMAHPRVLVVTGRGSEATIVETYGGVGRQRHLTNAVTEVWAGEGSTLTHYKVQREALDSFHIGAMYLRAARDANIACHSVSLGGSLVRNEVVAELAGEGAGCTLNGLYLGDGRRLVDNHTTIDHARANCGSREVYKGILAGQARAVFNGKIVVRPDAQKTDAKQTNKALLLSEEAQINTKPQLEIFANDVKCTHGAAVGQMDDEAIFYLRARGVGEQEARQMLIRAFAADVLNHMPLAALRAQVEAELVQRLLGWTT